jgi:TrmH family RNA methyltransferase
MQLKRYKKYKRDDPHSYSFGTFPTLELLIHRPEQARQVVAHSKGLASEGVARIEGHCRELGVPFEVNDRLVERLSHKGNVYVFAVFDKFTAPLDTSADHLLLVNPSDMGELGDHRPHHARLWGARPRPRHPRRRPLQPPRGARLDGGRVCPAHPAVREPGAYRALHHHRLYPFMLAGERRLDEVAFAPPCALVFGPEGAGLPERYREVGESVTIPQSPLVESLNLAVAVGIALYAAKGRAVP